MAINKNFVVKNGLEVNTDLILADPDANRVGIALTNPQYTLHVNGGIGATNAIVTGISTFNTIQSETANIDVGIVSSLTAINAGITSLNATNIFSSGVSTFVNANATNLNVAIIDVDDKATINNMQIGGYVAIGGTTGKDGQVLVSTGTGVSWSKLSKNTILSIAYQGQDTFLFNYEVGSVEVYINGVRLVSTEYTADDGSSVILADPCFGGETVEILASQTLPLASIEVPIGITIKDNNSIVGTANSVRTVNFVGTGVTSEVVSSSEVKITIQDLGVPPGKTIYVTVNGNDLNDGSTLAFAKATIKSAAGIATAGDTIKVSPGTYVENNPVILPENISIEGLELRNCIVTPQNPGSDLFWVSNGNHLTDLSFQGQTATNDAAVIAFKPLVGIASNRFIDAARMIRYNLDFIAAEAVGYLTSTDYRSPAFTLSGGDYTSCKDDIKDIFRAVCHDIVRGGNSKCVGAGLSYFSGNTLQHIVGVKTETIDTIKYAAGIAQSCINNVSWTGNYQNQFYQLKDLSIQADPLSGSNQDNNSCANVISSVYSCVGVVTTIVDQGPGVVGSLFNLTYPGNAGIGTTNPNDIPSQGVGVVTKGPYIRNCTNFIPNTVGMRVDGYHADPGDKDDIGVQGTMSVDSYTQFNQGGTGVEIKNGAYAQLVSIFTICTNASIVTEGGGQCDVTNSNSSFGTYGLVSNGVGGPTSKSIYRYTGEVSSSASERDITVTISGIGTNKPYTGQVVYFDELYYEVESVTIIDGGSGYDGTPPTVTSPVVTISPVTLMPSEVVASFLLLS